MKYETEVRSNGEEHMLDCDWEHCQGCGGSKPSYETKEEYRLRRLQLKREQKINDIING